MAGIAGTDGLSAGRSPVGPFHFEPARREDDVEIRRLLRSQPLGGRVRLALTREPSVWLAAEIEGERHHTVVARDDDGNIAGVGSRAVRQLWLGGNRLRVGYLGQLRRSAGATRHMRLLARGFAELERSRLADETSFDLTSIVADNAPARRLLERRLPGFPHYRPIGELTTLMLEVARRRRISPRIVRGTASRIPEICDFLCSTLSRHPFAPVWTKDALVDSARTRGLEPEDFSLLEERGKIVGCCALWDQRSFKQVVVSGYDGAVARSRPWINLGRRLSGRPTFPPRGQELALGYISHFAVAASRRDSIELVGSAVARARQKGLEHVVLGLPTRDPVTTLLQRTFRGHAYLSNLYIVHRPGDSSWRSILDGGLPRVEVATL